MAISPEMAASLTNFEAVGQLIGQQRAAGQPRLQPAEIVFEAVSVDDQELPVVEVAKSDPALPATDILGEAPLVSRTETKRSKLIQKAISVAAVVVGLALGASLVSRNSEARETQPIASSTPVEGLNIPESKVDSSYTFFANQAPAGSNHWGPAGQAGTLELSVGDQVYRMSEDPADLVGTSEFLNHLNTSNPQDRDQKVVEYINSPEEWNKKFAEIVQYLDSGKVSFVYKSGTYHTMYMVPNTNGDRPGIYQSVEEMSQKLLLQYDIPQADGSVKSYLFKVECGFQPVQFDEFKGIPKLPPKRTTTTTTQPPTTTTTIPIKTDIPNPGPHPQPGDPNGPEPSGDPTLDSPTNGYQPLAPQPAPLPSPTSPNTLPPRPPATQPAPRPTAPPTPVTTTPGAGNGPSGGEQPATPSN